MHPRSRQNWRRAVFLLISGWLCSLSLRLTLCLGQIRNPKWFYKKFTTIKQYCLIPQMDKTNYYSSMIHKPGLKIVNLPMCIASYNTIDSKSNMLSLHRGIDYFRQASCRNTLVLFQMKTNTGAILVSWRLYLKRSKLGGGREGLLGGDLSREGSLDNLALLSICKSKAGLQNKNCWNCHPPKGICTKLHT